MFTKYTRIFDIILHFLIISFNRRGGYYPEELSNKFLSKLMPFHIKQMMLHHFISKNQCHATLYQTNDTTPHTKEMTPHHFIFTVMQDK